MNAIITTLEVSAAASLPTSHGIFEIHAVRCPEGTEHVAVVKGEVADKEDVPVRVHSQCMTGEALHSMRCDCYEQLDAALDYFEEHGRGLLVYMRQEGRGIGLYNKIEAYALQDGGLDTVEANVKLGFPSDSRTYEIAAEVIRRLSIRSLRLLTNNPHKMSELERHGIKVNGRVPLRIPSNQFNDPYLQTKKQKMAHLL